MTEFKKLSENVQEWQQTLDKLDQSIVLQSNVVPSSSSTLPSLEEVDNFLTLFSTLQTLVQTEIIPRITKFKQRALEPDQEKRMYGPTMCTKILELAAQVDTLLPRYESIEKQTTDYWRPWAAKEKDHRYHQSVEEEKTKLIQLEKEKQRLEEEENARLAALKAEKELALQQRKLAAAQLQLEQEQRQKQQEELKRKEDEIRKRTLAEADAKAKAEAEERERRDREDRRRRAEEAVHSAKIASGIASSSSSSSSLNTNGTMYYRTGIVNEVTSPAHFQNILQSAKDSIVLVDWFAHWCGPCKRIAPLLDELAKHQTDVIFCKIDGDAQPILTATANIRAFPTFHIYFRNKLQESFSGANIDLIKMNLSKVASTAEEILLSEAVAASMDEGNSDTNGKVVPSVGLSSPNTASNTVSLSSSSSSSSSSVRMNTDNTTKDDDMDDQSLLSSVLQLHMVPDKNSKNSSVSWTSSSSSLSSSTDNNSTDTNQTVPLSPAKEDISIRSTLQNVLQELRKTITKAEYTAALQALNKYVENLLAHPTEIMYRSIKKSNPAFRARISRHVQGEKLMQLLGFTDTMKGEGSTAELHMVYSPLNSTTDSAASDIRLLIAKELFGKDLKELTADTSSPSTSGSSSSTTSGSSPSVPTSTSGIPSFPGMNNNLFGGLGGNNPFGGGNSMGGGMDMNNIMSMMNDPMVRAAMNNPAIMQQAMNMASSMGLGGSTTGANNLGNLGGLTNMLNTPNQNGTTSTPVRNSTNGTTIEDEEAALQEAIRLSMIEEEEKNKKRNGSSDKKE